VAAAFPLIFSWHVKASDNLPYAFYEKTADGTVRDITEELPFDVPETWVWVRLDGIVYNHGQMTPQEDFCYIDIGSINNHQQCLNEQETVVTAAKAPSRARKIVEQRDILYSTVRPYLHNMCIVDKPFSYTPIASTGFAVMACYEGLDNRFLFNFLLSPNFDNYANDTENSKGVAYPAINDTRLYNALIPLPPLAEQRRILARIEELLPHIADYDVAEQKLTALNTNFPDQLKKSILQSAVQGKLVPQDPNDEPASVLLERIRVEKEALIKAGKLKRDKHESVIFRRDNSHYETCDGEEACIDGELPFEIPQSWEWVRLGTIGTFIRGNGIKRSDVKPNGVPCVRYGEIYTTYNIAMTNAVSCVDEKMAVQAKPVKYGDLLLTLTGESKEEIGKTVAFLGRDKTVIGGDLATFTNHRQNSMYLSYLLNAPCGIQQKSLLGTGDIIVHISCDKLASILVPLPSLAEQQRIVEHIDKLLPLFDINKMPSSA
jgi:type I restriction enzyme S subunit